MMNIETIYNEYFYQLYLFSKKIVGNRKDAEDIVSEVFFRIIKFNLLENVNNLNSFLYTSVRNKSIDHLRRIDKLNMLVFEGYDEAEEIADIELKLDILKAYANKISKNKRKVFLLIIAGLSDKQIANHLNMQYQSIRNEKLRIYKEIRKIFKPFKLCSS